METGPLVSVCCITYNQQQYIEEMISCILRQNTTFDFEILIHDDASTDGTLEILKKYEKANENIQLFTEVENRYKDGINYINEILIPHARGKYIAICEGDDYWISKSKLQRSVEYLESHPECSLFSNAAIIQNHDGAYIGTMGLGDKERDLITRDLVRDWHIPTVSFVFKKTDAVRNIQEWKFKTPVGDFPRAFYLSTLGFVHYCPEKLCVYRYGSEGSWTNKNRTSISAAVDSARAWLKMLENIDAVTCGKYHDAVLNSAENKVVRLYGRAGEKALDNPIADAAWGRMKTKKRILAYLLRLMTKLGWDFQRVNWSGPKQWVMVRIDK